MPLGPCRLVLFAPTRVFHPRRRASRRDHGGLRIVHRACGRSLESNVDGGISSNGLRDTIVLQIGPLTLSLTAHQRFWMALDQHRDFARMLHGSRERFYDHRAPLRHDNLCDRPAAKPLERAPPGFGGLGATSRRRNQDANAWRRSSRSPRRRRRLRDGCA